MIHIKVIRASQLIYAALVVIVVIAAILLGIWLLGENRDQITPTTKTVAVAVTPQPTVFHEVIAAFSQSSIPIIDVVFDDPDIELQENEHSDPKEEMQINIFAENYVPAPVVKGDQVLIYHTHTHEAYEQNDNDRYTETSKWRTSDQTHSIVYVGSELERLLEAASIGVTHDLTDHEPPALGTSYTRSLETLEKYEQNGQTFRLYIDMHRDAYNQSLNGNPSSIIIDGRSVARIMVLIGTGEGSEFTEKPEYKKNLQLAQRLTDELEAIAPGITHPILIKSGRYNQHMSPNAILIEVGHNMNTLDEAVAAMTYLSRAISVILL